MSFWSTAVADAKVAFQDVIKVGTEAIVAAERIFGGGGTGAKKLESAIAFVTAALKGFGIDVSKNAGEVTSILNDLVALFNSQGVFPKG